jgi:hypothetical protein
MIIMTNEADKKSLPDMRKVERSFWGTTTRKSRRMGSGGLLSQQWFVAYFVNPYARPDPL